MRGAGEGCAPGRSAAHAAHVMDGEGLVGVVGGEGLVREGCRLERRLGVARF